MEAKESLNKEIHNNQVIIGFIKGIKNIKSISFHSDIKSYDRFLFDNTNEEQVLLSKIKNLIENHYTQKLSELQKQFDEL